MDEQRARTLWGTIRGKLALSFLLGLAIIIALAIYADLSRLGSTLSRFRWSHLPLILGLTLFNYAFRFLKWEFYLRQVGIGVKKVESAAIFASGLAMVMTPGKVGELLKSYLLKQVSGASMSLSAPIIVAERLTDGLAMVVLATMGLLLYPFGRPIIVAVAALLLTLVALVQFRPLALRLLRWGQRLPLLSRLARELNTLYESAYTLMTPRNLLVALALSVVSWGGECIAFYLILVGLGLPGHPSLLLRAAFIFGSSAVMGAISFLPGGLGVADASLAGLTLLLTQVERSTAIAASLLIRLCTLWFGATLGLAVLFVFRRRFFIPLEG